MRNVKFIGDVQVIARQEDSGSYLVTAYNQAGRRDFLLHSSENILLHSNGHESLKEALNSVKF